MAPASAPHCHQYPPLACVPPAPAWPGQPPLGSTACAHLLGRCPRTAAVAPRPGGPAGEGPPSLCRCGGRRGSGQSRRNAGEGMCHTAYKHCQPACLTCYAALPPQPLSCSCLTCYASPPPRPHLLCSWQCLAASPRPQHLAALCCCCPAGWHAVRPHTGAARGRSVWLPGSSGGRGVVGRSMNCEFFLRTRDAGST